MIVLALSEVRKGKGILNGCFHVYIFKHSRYEFVEKQF